MKFTSAEKAAEVKREIGQRQWVYPKQVADGKLAQALANRRIAIMEEIAGDYLELVRKEQLL